MRNLAGSGWAVVVASLLVALGAFAAVPAAAATLAPVEHADFAYYTFALTWQPGICSTDDGCVADQPHDQLVGLHGLWASLPQSLAAQGVTSPQWWSRGCDFLSHSDAAPVLDSALEARLGDAMPHFAHSLLTHEYDKHVQCFGFDATQYFTTELAMRDAVVANAFGRYLATNVGRTVAHADVVAAFATDFVTSSPTSLQLECGHDASGQSVLTQLWISIDATALAAFPAASSLIAAPIAQDSCPATFTLPAWKTATR